MTSADIRQSFLDFFQSKQHAIVPSSSLMPTAPNLLFTNAGMNQFVPYFLGDQSAPWKRVADTQKCIRAGGKHNDLEDVGFDTYHHTMFEMLGNWSFGDYFKKESLTWGWELLTKVWGIPPKRLFATVYSPDKSKGDPSDFDQEAYDIWAGIFKAAGLDPAVHIVNGNKKDNFWMMGDTGPCGPCSEIHFNLQPDDNEAAGRANVNSSSPRCIEIWNHVFIQFNAAPATPADEAKMKSGGKAGEDWYQSFVPLAAKHVDTGMGFERVAGIHATTNGFKDFTAEPSNYNADVFKPTFDKLAALSGKTYTKSVPTKRDGLTEQEQIDIAFRVLADHARCVSCAIADGILPGNDGRNNVIKKILRRGIYYGREKLGLKIGFFEALVDSVIVSLGSVFPELIEHRALICRIIRQEEESYSTTIDKGIAVLESQLSSNVATFITDLIPAHIPKENLFQPLFHDPGVFIPAIKYLGSLPVGPISSGEIKHAFSTISFPISGAMNPNIQIQPKAIEDAKTLSGSKAFVLHDTHGLQIDIANLRAQELGYKINYPEFEIEMNKQRGMGRAARKTDVIVASTEGEATAAVTKFTGYEIDATHATHAKLVDVVKTEKDTYLVFDQTPFYAEMGGQVGDSGHALIAGHKVDIADTIKDKSGRYLHKVSGALNSQLSTLNSPAVLAVDFSRRRAISRHHSAAHLIHWALRKMLGTHVRQFGTHKTPDRMRFDFTHFEALTHAQIRECEQLINEKVIDNAHVIVEEIDYDKKPADVLAFFGDKYGKRVRLVDIGGYSKELCGGTHVATTGEIGVIKIVAEMAIAAGTRRIEAVAGQAALDFIATKEAALAAVSTRLNAGVTDVVPKFEQILTHQKELEQKLKAFEAKASAALAGELAATAVAKDGLSWVSAVVTADNADALRSLGSQVLHKVGPGAVVQLGALMDGKVSLVAYCSPEAIKAGQAAGKLIGALSGKLGGKGGGKPDYAQGGGGDASKLADVLKL